MKNGEQSSQPTGKVQRMISEFSNLATLKWVGVAFCIHVVVIGLFSIGSIYKLSGGEEAVTTDANEGKTPTTAPTTGPATRSATRPATRPAGAAVKKPVKPATSDKEGDGDESKITPAMRELLAPAKPSEIPKAPTNMDIDEPVKPKTIQDANREIHGKSSP